MNDIKISVAEHQKLLLNPRNAARLLSISERTLWELTHRSENPIPHVRLGRCLRYLIADLLAWVSTRRKGVER